MSIDILKGNSGCPISVSGDRVIKRSKSSEYNCRIFKSYEKMISQPVDIFMVPDTKIDAGYLSTLDMEYISGIPMVVAIDVMDNFSAIRFANNLIEFVGNNFESTIEISDDILCNKLKDIRYRENYYIPKFNIEVGAGYCHGDLTFSNMIYSNSGDIYFIDHLDSYIESPIMDIVKLHQDLDYYWSIRYFRDYTFSDNFYRNVGLIKEVIFSRFCNAEWYKYINYFLFVNYARILPYLTSEKDKKELNLYMATLL